MICCPSCALQQDYWEALYNHKEICESVLCEGSRVAKALFCSKVNLLVQLAGAPLETETAFILLTSLNRSLYDYVLFHQNLSLAECCYCCRVHTHTVRDHSSLLAAANQIIDAYVRCLEESRSSRTHVEKACAYIKAHLSEDLSLAAVSSELFLSKNHLCSIFKKLTGITFCDYVRQQRIRHARMLLITSARNIDDISAACGFSSPTYFATVFKSVMGLSPSAFRHKFSQ